MKRQIDIELFESLWDELHRGHIYECSLRSEFVQFDGLQVGEQIFIDPRPAILETVFHELLHRMKPRWRERRVEREARNLVSRMEDIDKRKWWLAYRKIRRVGKPVDVEE